MEPQLEQPGGSMVQRRCVTQSLGLQVAMQEAPASSDVPASRAGPADQHRRARSGVRDAASAAGVSAPQGACSSTAWFYRQWRVHACIIHQKPWVSGPDCAPTCASAGAPQTHRIHHLRFRGLRSAAAAGRRAAIVHVGRVDGGGFPRLGLISSPVVHRCRMNNTGGAPVISLHFFF